MLLLAYFEILLQMILELKSSLREASMSSFWVLDLIPRKISWPKHSYKLELKGTTTPESFNKSKLNYRSTRFYFEDQQLHKFTKDTTPLTTYSQTKGRVSESSFSTNPSGPVCSIPLQWRLVVFASRTNTGPGGLSFPLPKPEYSFTAPKSKDPEGDCAGQVMLDCTKLNSGLCDWSVDRR